jgi:hypothetical protein
MISQPETADLQPKRNFRHSQALDWTLYNAYKSPQFANLPVKDAQAALLRVRDRYLATPNADKADSYKQITAGLLDVAGALEPEIPGLKEALLLETVTAVSRRRSTTPSIPPRRPHPRPRCRRLVRD